jgi:hypothetical protein
MALINWHSKILIKFGYFLDTAVRSKHTQTVALDDKFINLLVKTKAIKGNAFCTAKLTLDCSFERPHSRIKDIYWYGMVHCLRSVTLLCRGKKKCLLHVVVWDTDGTLQNNDTATSPKENVRRINGDSISKRLSSQISAKFSPGINMTSR